LSLSILGAHAWRVKSKTILEDDTSCSRRSATAALVNSNDGLHQARQTRPNDLPDQPLHADAGRACRDAESPRHHAACGCPHHPEIPARTPIQFRVSRRRPSGTRDCLRALENSRRFAPPNEGFHQYRLAKPFLSRVRRLYGHQGV